MATSKEFVARVDRIAGVAGCLLVRSDGVLLGQSVDDPELYATLLLLSGGLGSEVQDRVGFSRCRQISFSRRNKEHFFVFPIDKYLLGVVQRPDCQVAEMLDAVHRLVARVTTTRNGEGG